MHRRGQTQRLHRLQHITSDRSMIGMPIKDRMRVDIARLHRRDHITDIALQTRRRERTMHAIVKVVIVTVAVLIGRVAANRHRSRSPHHQKQTAPCEIPAIP